MGPPRHRPGHRSPEHATPPLGHWELQERGGGGERWGLAARVLGGCRPSPSLQPWGPGGVPGWGLLVRENDPLAPPWAAEPSARVGSRGPCRHQRSWLKLQGSWPAGRGRLRAQMGTEAGGQLTGPLALVAPAEAGRNGWSQAQRLALGPSGPGLLAAWGQERTPASGPAPWALTSGGPALAPILAPAADCSPQPSGGLPAASAPPLPPLHLPAASPSATSS